MNFGIYLPNFGSYGDARALANLARDAENSGWDGFFMWDHVAGWKLPMVDPWVALAAIAVATERIRIGTTVTPLPRRRPWKLAREAVSIDHLSGGRLTLGVGIGGGDSEWAHLDEQPDPRKRGLMLDDNAQELAQLETLVRYLGEHRELDQPFDVVCMGVSADADSREAVELVEQRAESGATWWLECLTPYRSGRGYDDEWPVAEMRERVLQGPPHLRGTQSTALRQPT